MAPFEENAVPPPPLQTDSASLAFPRTEHLVEGEPHFGRYLPDRIQWAARDASCRWAEAVRENRVADIDVFMFRLAVFDKALQL